MTDDAIGFPAGSTDEKELLLGVDFRYLRTAVLRNVDGLDDAQAHWRPAGRLISLVGIVNHRTRVEWRWIDGAFQGAGSQPQRSGVRARTGVEPCRRRHCLS